jgi:ABC-2 type transport system ATP-binding protein
MSEHNDPAIQLNGITRVFSRRRAERGRFALDTVNLAVGRGERVALLGPNGSGKSTLVALVLGLDRPTAGTIRVLGGPPGGAARRRGEVAAVRQTVGLDPLLTVRENLMLTGELYRVIDPARAAAACAHNMGVGDRLDDRVSTLSGGLARRSDLARAAIASPQLLALDEPAAGLDIEARRSLVEMIADRSLGGDAAVLIATHHAELAEVCDRAVFMRAGEVIADGAPSQLRDRFLGGAACVRVPRDHARRLDRSRLVLHQLLSGVIGAGEPGVVAEAAADLVREGVPVRSGPATLEDAYAVATGRGLGVGSEETAA